MGDTPKRVVLELAIDAETRVLATPGNFSDAAKWLIQLDPEQVLPDPLDTPEAHENAMKHRRRTQAPPVRQLLAAWDTVTHKARYCHVAHGSDAWQVTRDDACKIVLLAALLREDFDGDSLGLDYPWDGPDECEFSFEGRCWVNTLLTSGGIPALSVGLVIELVQEAIRILPASESPTAVVEASVIPDKPKRRPKRTEVDTTRDDLNIAIFLRENPCARRDDVVKGTEIAAAHVSASHAWKRHAMERQQARKKNRARGIGGA